MYCTPGGMLPLVWVFFVHNLSLICLQLDEMSCISVQLTKLQIINFCDSNYNVVALFIARLVLSNNWNVKTTSLH